MQDYLGSCPIGVDIVESKIRCAPAGIRDRDTGQGTRSHSRRFQLSLLTQPIIKYTPSRLSKEWRSITPVELRYRQIA
jgi:hypothetical protein